MKRLNKNETIYLPEINGGTYFTVQSVVKSNLNSEYTYRLVECTIDGLVDDPVIIIWSHNKIESENATIEAPFQYSDTEVI